MHGCGEHEAEDRWNRLQVSTVLGAALPDQREEKEWIEGVAIWIAVIAVTMVGE